VGHKWYVYAELEPRDAVRRIAEAQHALAEALLGSETSPDAIVELGVPAIEITSGPLPTLDEVSGETSSEVRARLSRCTLGVRIDRPPDDALAMTAVRHFLRGLSRAVVMRGFSYETVEDVLADLPTERGEEPKARSAEELVRQSLAHFADPKAMTGTCREPDVADALELVRSLQAIQRSDAELARVGPALTSLSALAQKYVRDLLQYGSFGDVDAARMYEVSAKRVAEIRAEVRRALAH
jgi:hypothetical protein